MEWIDKTKMIQLGNVRTESLEAKKEFQNFVLQHISEFDNQAWDMFCNLSDLIVSDMKLDKKYWKIVYEHVKDIDCNNENFNFRTSMRLAMIQTICEDELIIY